MEVLCTRRGKHVSLQRHLGGSFPSDLQQGVARLHAGWHCTVGSGEPLGGSLPMTPGGILSIFIPMTLQAVGDGGDGGRACGVPGRKETK